MVIEINYSNVPTEIYRQLRERILRGKLLGGDQVKIEAVAKEFGVSIIPVREAIRMLNADNLIDIVPRRSPVVSGLSKIDVLEIADIRLALEPLALAKAMPYFTDSILASCNSVLDKYQKSRNSWKQVELNRKFHLKLYEPCPSQRLKKIIAEQYDGMTRCAHVMVIRSSKKGDKSFAEHKAILRACKKQDTELAVQKLRAHLLASIERVRHELIDSA